MFNSVLNGQRPFAGTMPIKVVRLTQLQLPSVQVQLGLEQEPQGHMVMESMIGCLMG